MSDLTILCGVGIGICGFINFFVEHGYKSLGNMEMAAIGTKLVIVCLVSSLLFIIWGMLDKVFG